MARDIDSHMMQRTWRIVFTTDVQIWIPSAARTLPAETHKTPRSIGNCTPPLPLSVSRVPPFLLFHLFISDPPDLFLNVATWTCSLPLRALHSRNTPRRHRPAAWWFFFHLLSIAISFSFLAVPAAIKQLHRRKIEP